MKSPKPLDVVWCNFPLREVIDAPGPKARPILVLNIAPDGTVIAAAYGTSQAHAAPRDWELRHEAQRSTLTTFDLSRVLPLPATRDYFPPGLPALRAFPVERFAEVVAADAAARAALAARRQRSRD